MTVRFSLPTAQGQLRGGHDTHAKLDPSRRQQLGGSAYLFLSETPLLLHSALPTIHNLPHSLTIALKVEKFWTILLGRRVSKISKIDTIVDMSIDSLITIAGYNESTKIAPLLQAFETINLTVTFPGLKTDLLSSAALTGESLWGFHRP